MFVLLLRTGSVGGKHDALRPEDHALDIAEAPAKSNDTQDDDSVSVIVRLEVNRIRIRSKMHILCEFGTIESEAREGFTE
jgi:hypothetical protein